MLKRSKPPTTCTIEELMNIMTAPYGGMCMLPSNAVDEVYPNIYIGEESIASNPWKLKSMGITHVVNTAKGPKDRYHVNISPVYYAKSKIDQLGIEATDQMNFELSQYFEKTSEYIDSALKTGGKVLVHCREGVSRSATITLAYLMLKQHMTVQDALRQVHKHRNVCPNDGFCLQLCHLNDDLTASGHFDKKPSETTATELQASGGSD